MHSIKLTLQYDGTDFSGYELQPGKRTIRGVLEVALRNVYKQKIKISAVSRTDSGVHALDAVVFYQANKTISIEKITLALNSELPADLRVIKAEGDNHGKVKSKTYEYLIYNGKILPPHLRRIAWHVKPKLNLLAMKKAAKHLIGKHNFSSFCATGGEDNNFVRIIHQLIISHLSLVIWEGIKIKVIRIRVVGNGFLYKMVRNIVGTLIDVGLAKIAPEEIVDILKAKDRKQAGRTAPAQGLCLTKIAFN